MIPVSIMAQPDDLTCGPTSLHAVYSYYHDHIPLRQVIQEVSYLEEGGTLAVCLGIHALKRGYRAKVYTYNLNVFDPSWSQKSREEMIARLELQTKFKKGKKLLAATPSYVEFLRLGGEIRFENLELSLLNKFFKKDRPVLAGLSATYLYQCAREVFDGKKLIYDDLRGVSSGHFVVLCGYDETRRRLIVADPYAANPVSHDHYYSVQAQRLINSILLGVVTYDANLLIIEPESKGP